MFGDMTDSIIPIEFQPSKDLELFQKVQDSFSEQVSDVTGISAMRFSDKHDRIAKNIASILKAGRLNFAKRLKENHVW